LLKVPSTLCIVTNLARQPVMKSKLYGPRAQVTLKSGSAQWFL
jgi:hypothetical protein